MDSKKVFTVEDALAWYRIPPVRHSAGTKVRTTKLYSAGDDKDGPLVCEILTIETNSTKQYELNETLTKAGYTHQEMYRVKNSDGTENVLWPEECEAV